MLSGSPSRSFLLRLSLRAQLNGLIAAGLLVAFALACMAYADALKSARSVQKVYVAKDVTADILPPPLYLVGVRLLLSQAVEGTIQPTQAQQEFALLRADYESRVKYWQENPPFGLEADLLGVQHQTAIQFLEASARLLDALASGAEANVVMEGLRAAHVYYLAHRSGVDSTVRSSISFADAAMHDAASIEATTPWKIGCGLLLAALALSALGLSIRRAIWSSLGGEPREAVLVTEAVAGGDLNRAVKVPIGDEESLMSHLKRMQESLSQVVSSVRDGAECVATASQQIAQGNTDLSDRTAEQASSLQETAAAMEQLSAALARNADHAHQADQLARIAKSVAVRGDVAVAEMVGTMKRISESARRIGDIISTIDGIAFQTNILALNASVEAARAGEQGRGFAVVSSEVRSLAQRSSTAAREIKILVAKSVDQVELGDAQVDQTRATMCELSDAIERVTAIVSEICVATHQQSAGIASVSTAISQMDNSTQQNASLVEQSSVAAQSLAQRARELLAAVSVFRARE